MIEKVKNNSNARSIPAKATKKGSNRNLTAWMLSAKPAKTTLPVRNQTAGFVCLETTTTEVIPAAI